MKNRNRKIKSLKCFFFGCLVERDDFTCSESDPDADDADDSDSESDNLGFLLFFDAIVSESCRLFCFRYD